MLSSGDEDIDEGEGVCELSHGDGDGGDEFVEEFEEITGGQRPAWSISCKDLSAAKDT